MRGTPPPRLAAWLFERLASGPNRESLGGDLAEQYRGGRSSAWYWRQVLMAVWASTTRDIGRHKLTAVRAVVISWMFLIPWLFFTGWVYGSTKFWVMETLIRGSIGFHDLWVIYAAPLLITWCLGSALIGWVVARLEPDCRAGMLFVCAAVSAAACGSVGCAGLAIGQCGSALLRQLPRHGQSRGGLLHDARQSVPRRTHGCATASLHRRVRTTEDSLTCAMFNRHVLPPGC